MQSLIKMLTGMAAMAALGAVLMAGTTQVASAQAPAAQQAAQPGQPAAKAKVPKDQGEADIANATIVDMVGVPANWQKALTDLNTWVQKYPESDWKNDRLIYYVQAYTGVGQRDKALEYAAQLLAMDIPTVFPDKQDQLKVYLYSADAVPGIKNATPEQLATGQKAAKLLLAFIPTYFTAANKPATASDVQWSGLRQQLTDVGNAADMTVSTYAGDQAAGRQDWVTAEAGYRKALQDHSDSWNIAYQLGSAIIRQKNPDTFAQGLYFVARAVAMDPTKGGIPDAAQRTQIDNFLKSAYTTFHGGDDGLAELKQQALASAVPPAGFKIKTSSEVALEKQQEFAKSNPQVALWMQMKAMLAGADSDAGFAQMKDTMVKGQEGAKGLIGTMMSGEPACNSKSVQVSVPVPGSTATPVAELTLKLDKPLKGKPIAGTQIKWDGVPSAFTKEPFMLTMDVDQTDIDGMAVDQCTPPVTKKAPPKTGAKKPPPKQQE